MELRRRPAVGGGAGAAPRAEARAIAVPYPASSQVSGPAPYPLSAREEAVACGRSPRAPRGRSASPERRVEQNATVAYGTGHMDSPSGSLLAYTPECRSLS